MKIQIERDLGQLKQDIACWEWAHKRLVEECGENFLRVRELREIIDWHKEVVAFHEAANGQ